jgi:hypothetical protein
MPISVLATINAPIDQVWALISNFGDLMRWHPQVERCETEGKGIGARRSIYFADWSTVEELTALDNEHHILEYLVVDSSRPPVIGAAGSMTLKVKNSNTTSLEWVSGFPDESPHAAAVSAGLEAYYPVRVGHLKAALGVA